MYSTRENKPIYYMLGSTRIAVNLVRKWRKNGWNLGLYWSCLKRKDWMSDGLFGGIDHFAQKYWWIWAWRVNHQMATYWDWICSSVLVVLFLRTFPWRKETVNYIANLSWWLELLFSLRKMSVQFLSLLMSSKLQKTVKIWNSTV